MPKPVIDGAILKCSQGLAPGPLRVLAARGAGSERHPVATVMEFQPVVNIAGFSMCQSPANPQVAAATAATGGVLTPQPCVPVVVAPWQPGSQAVRLGGLPVLTETSTCQCSWAGLIEVSHPGSVAVTEGG